MSPVKNMVWKQLAACRGVEPEIFYPVTDEEAEEAKAICAACPVREMCLDFALGNRERDGVWVAPPSVSGAGFSASAGNRPRASPVPCAGIRGRAARVASGHAAS